MDAVLYQQHSELERTHWWFRARRQIITDVLRRTVVPTGGDDRRILDVGCGTGGMLGALAEFGTVTGMEMEPDAVAWARQQMDGTGIDVMQGSLPEGIPPKAWDLITAFDVIEHLDDDGAVLERIHASLRPGGQIMVTVPAYMFLWSPHDDLNQHKRRYTRRQLVDRMRAAGFTVQRTSYFNTWLFPVVAAVRLVKRGRRRAENDAPETVDRAGDSDFSMPGSAVNEVLRRLFASERFLLRRIGLPAGVSIIAVGRRA
jgi:2-polyprenyl-3-methyl-5-hydroxy-6-metoxy-1,4-benzoquinol methylase